MQLSISELLQLIYKRLYLILSLTVLGGSILYMYNQYILKPVYTASVKLYVNSNNATTNESLNDLNYAQKIVNTYISFLQTQEFYKEVLEQTGLQYTTKQLAQMTSIATVNSTEIFEVSVASTSASDSFTLVSAMQKIAPKLISSIKENTKISVVDPVVYPQSASGPKVFVNTMIGSVFGFLLAIFLCLLKKMFDVKIKGEEELTVRYAYPILGTVPSFDKLILDKKRIFRKIAWKKRRNASFSNIQTINTETDFLIVEAYKALRTNLRYTLRNEGCKTILVNSPMPGDGKSTTCTNTAITIAQTGARVLIIDCDLRKGRQHKVLGLQNENGISDLISGIKTETDVIKETKYEGLHVITIGRIPPNPTELLSSSQMEEVIKSLERYYDYILIDTPPVNIVSDALSLSKLVDGVLFVVMENSTTHPNIEAALNKYKLVDGKILGFLINGSTIALDMKEKSNYYYENEHH